MSEPIVSVAGLATNSSVLPLEIRVYTCPHCGEAVPAMVSRWEFSRRAGRRFPCPACDADMHDDGDDSPSHESALDKLTARQRDVLQAIIENQPVKYEELAEKAGVSTGTVGNALKALSLLGVRSTPAGYVAPKGLILE